MAFSIFHKSGATLRLPYVWGFQRAPPHLIWIFLALSTDQFTPGFCQFWPYLSNYKSTWSKEATSRLYMSRWTHRYAQFLKLPQLTQTAVGVNWPNFDFSLNLRVYLTWSWFLWDVQGMGQLLVCSSSKISNYDTNRGLWHSANFEIWSWPQASLCPWLPKFTFPNSNGSVLACQKQFPVKS